MRVDLKKFLMIGLESDREAFFKKAQEFGIIHFININPVAIKEIPEKITQLTSAIKILRGLPTTEQEETSEYAIAEGLSVKIIRLQEQLDQLLEKERLNELDIARVEPFGHFLREDIERIEKEGNRKIQFFCAKSGYAENHEIPPELVFIISEHGLDYFVSINKEPHQYDKMSEMHIEQPLGSLLKQKKEIQQEIHHTEHHLKKYAKYNRFLHHALTHELNIYHLQTANTYAQETANGELFAIEGWVPENEVEPLHKFVKKMNVHLEEIAIEPTDRVPTCLQNKGLNRVGEDLVHIYDTPSNTDKDPSIWVLFFFALFFGMIVGDGGYGLMFLLGALFIRYKYKNLKAVGKRVWVLVVLLSCACIMWGFLTTSFFGYNFSKDSPLRKISLMHWLVEKKANYHFQHQDEDYKEWIHLYPQLKDAKNGHDFLYGATKQKINDVTYPIYSKIADNILLELALLIGIVHLTLSFIRYLDRNWSGIGWIAFMWGCYLYLPSYLHVTTITNYVFGLDVNSAAQEGMYLIMGGVIVACVLGIIKHKLLGVFEIMTLIQVFADSMSYLRLYALALAGSMVTAIINEFAGTLPFVLGLALFFIGHLTNMALGIMGGIIHGLRLNFLEWYHYSFEGGGKMFNPLRLLTQKE